VQELFALCDEDLIDTFEKAYCFVAAKRLLLGVGLFVDRYFVFRKKLLRFSTARSTLTMIVPIQLAHAFRMTEVICSR